MGFEADGRNASVGVIAVDNRRARSGLELHPRAAIAKDTPGAIEASMLVPLKAGAEASRDPEELTRLH